jgi:mutator protein MutT
MKEYKQLGSYAIIIKDESILLINKNGGPYHGKYDLPGGTIEFGETPEQALFRELLEEVGVIPIKYSLFDSNSVHFKWDYKEKDVVLDVHHTGIFYNVDQYDGEIHSQISIDELNDDSLGALFVPIESLTTKDLSPLAVFELNKIGYIIKK